MSSGASRWMCLESGLPLTLRPHLVGRGSNIEILETTLCVLRKAGVPEGLFNRTE